MKIDRLKKVELHCHLDGSLRPETMFEILKDEKDLSRLSLEEFTNLVQVKEDNDSLVEYLKKFKYPGKAMQTRENLARVTYELLEDLSNQNVMYVEIRFAPYLHMNEGLSFDEVMESVIGGLDSAKEEFDIDGNLILIGMRHESLEKTIELVKEGKKYLDSGVVGFDIAGDEEGFAPEIHKEAFLLAKDLGYNLTVHAGETGRVENIWTAIDDLRAQRIGHGIAAINDELLMEELSKREIFLEMCPISNMQTKAVEKLEAYPIKEFLNRGIKVTINTDNMTVSGTNLKKEYEFLMDNYDLEMKDIIALVENSIDGSWVSEEKKELMREKLKNSIE